MDTGRAESEPEPETRQKKVVIAVGQALLAGKALLRS
jgi:hypothetical protein